MIKFYIMTKKKIIEEIKQLSVEDVEYIEDQLGNILNEKRHLEQINEETEVVADADTTNEEIEVVADVETANEVTEVVADVDISDKEKKDVDAEKRKNLYA